MNSSSLQVYSSRIIVIFWILVIIVFFINIIPLGNRQIAGAITFPLTYGNTIAQKITIDHNRVAETVTDFPVYVNLADLGPLFFSSVKSNGGDIRVFQSNGTTEVPFELVRINTTNQTGELHFKATLSATVDTEYYITYGNSTLNAYADNATYGAQNVWTNGYEAVYHMGSGQLLDSTANNNDSSSNGGAQGTGVLGVSTSFSGSNNAIVPHSTSIGNDILSNLTYSAWIRNNGTWSRSFEKGNQYFLLNIAGAGSQGPLIKQSGVNRVADAGTLSNNTWHMVTAVFQGSTGTFRAYANNALIGTTTGLAPQIDASTEGLYMGSDNGLPQGTNIAYFNGSMDEVIISSVIRSLGWIQTQHANQSSASTFYMVGGQETAPSTLSVDIVNASGVTVSSPSATLSAAIANFNCQTVSGTIGTDEQRIRINNSTTSPAWTAAIAATSGTTSLWTSGSNSYDFNDPGGSPVGCGDSADSDTHPGQLSLSPSDGTSSPQAGCSNIGISLGSNSNYNEGTLDSLTLITGGGSAQTDCYWDLTGVTVAQTIPASQSADTYNLNLTITVVAN